MNSKTTPLGNRPKLGNHPNLGNRPKLGNRPIRYVFRIRSFRIIFRPKYMVTDRPT